jgi:hypothetical protein
MTVYSLVLFLHVGAALALASALSIDALLLFQLRRATNPSATDLWLDLWRAVPWMAGGSGLLLLFSGGYLAERMSAWTLAWPKVAVVTLILIGALGAATGSRMRELRRVFAAANEGGPENCGNRLALCVFPSFLDWQQLSSFQAENRRCLRRIVAPGTALTVRLDAERDCGEEKVEKVLSRVARSRLGEATKEDLICQKRRIRWRSS